jgi:hypothetical protein
MEGGNKKEGCRDPRDDGRSNEKKHVCKPVSVVVSIKIKTICKRL